MHKQHFDIKFSFFCRSSNTDKEGFNPIVLRISYRNMRKDIFTGLSCHSSHWDSVTQRIGSKEKRSVLVNQELSGIIHKCNNLYDQYKYSGKRFTLDEFIIGLKGEDEPLTTIMEYLNNKIVELEERVNIDITSATLQKYGRCIKHLKSFLKDNYRSKDISIANIDTKFILNFFYYLQRVRLNSHNTSVNYIKCLKTVLLPAIKDGRIGHDPFIGHKYTAKDVNRGFLTHEEIKKIEELTDVPDGVMQAKDIFLFACYTGLAYVDVQQFSNRHIKYENDGSYCINKPRQKTGKLCIIPLLAPAKRILESYSLTGKIEDFKWYVVTNQKMNEHLKTIGEKAGISQDLFFHLARHTFATTITLNNGVPLETVSKMLGHSSLKMTQRYAKISGYKIKEDMKRVSAIFI